MSDSPPSQTSDADLQTHLLVKAGDELYALPGGAVREVMRWRIPLPIPGAPAVIPGIISQRGIILPIVDLRRALGLAQAAPERATRLVVVDHDDVAMALLVDAVVDLILFPADELAPPPAGLETARARMLAAVTRAGDQPVGVVNLAGLIAAVQEG